MDHPTPDVIAILNIYPHSTLLRDMLSRRRDYMPETFLSLVQQFVADWNARAAKHLSYNLPSLAYSVSEDKETVWLHCTDYLSGISPQALQGIKFACWAFIADNESR